MQTAVNREVLIEFLRREVSKTPSGLAMDLVSSPLKASRGSQAPLVFLIPKEAESVEGQEFLETICKGMDFDRSKVLMANEWSEVSSHAKYVVCFGGVVEATKSEAEIIETLAPLDLKKNVSEKKRLWAQLKPWARELSQGR